MAITVSPALVSESARYTLAIYMLITSAAAFYMIYWATQTNFINDNKWVSDRGIPIDQRDALRNARNVYYYFGITLVIANFFMFLYLFSTKFRILSRY